MTTATSWQMLRSDIYVRDKGICWICNTFVELKDYDLGHLIDRCNGGQDSYDNLAVMHKSCNLTKPRHTSLEQAMKWKLTPKYLTERPLPLFDITPTIKTYAYQSKKRTIKTPSPQLSLLIDETKKQANEQLIESYFQAHPELVDKTNNVRLEVIKLLSKLLDMPEQKIVPSLNIPKPTIHDTLTTNDFKKSELIPVIKHFKKASQSKLNKYELKKQENLKKVIPGTLCWIQGRPTYINGTKKPMWRLIAPPYTPECSFILRETPPNAIDNGLSGINETIQILGGELTQEITSEIGFLTYKFSPDNNKIKVNIIHNNKSNITVGMGFRQIPIRIWREAKSKGIKYSDFINSYHLQNNPIS